MLHLPPIESKPVVLLSSMSIGANVATLVTARMDWQKFSVGELRAWHLARGRAPELRGALDAVQNGSQLKVSFVEGRTVPITHWPWHSYDFDFASLGLTLPHLA